MNKLTEYLNEYEPRIASDGEYYDNIWLFRTKMSDKIVANNATRYIVSKEYGFIKWLVDNDKIDVESYCRITSVERKGEKDVYRDEVDSLLMLLAISDTPIDDLISYLR